jgi:hypothetical protein
MAAAMSPIKVDAETDSLISHAAHFLGASKKDIVDRAVRDYIEGHRDDINEGIRAALLQLDGSNASAVSMMTGFSRDELDNLGGVPEK